MRKILAEDVVKSILYVVLVISKCATCCEVYSTTPTCTQLHQLQLSVDDTVDPCDDFYAYACGNWALQYKISDIRSNTEYTDHQMNLKLIRVMETLHQQSLAEKNPSQSIFDKSYIYYKSCVNEKRRNVTRYFDVIKPGPGLEWPLMEELQAYRRGDKNFVVKAWPSDQFDIFALLGQLRGYGLNSVLIRLETTKVRGGVHTLIERPQILKSEALSLTLLMDLLMYWLGLPEQTALKYAENILRTEEYWHGLYQHYLLKPSLIVTSYRSLKEATPPFFIFLRNILLEELQDHDTIQMFNTEYFLYLVNKQWRERESQDVCNYIMIKFLLLLLEDQGNDFTSTECIKNLRRKMDFPIHLLYYQYIYQPEELNYNRDISTLFSKAQQYVTASIKLNRLNLNASTLEELLSEVTSTTLNIGNLPRNLHMSTIEKLFADIPTLDLNNYYKNHLYFLRHRVLSSQLPLENQTYFIVNDNRMGSFSGPFYARDQQMLIVPLGVLQPPFYHYAYDPIFKWSMLGFLIVHGLAVASLSNALLIESVTPPNCVQQQKDIGYLYEMKPDVASIRTAYNAYINEQKAQLQPEFSNTSWKKLFFLNFSQYFCVRLNDSLKDFNQYAVRLNNMVKNMESFSEAFQCPVNSKMNPKDKCRIY